MSEFSSLQFLVLNFSMMKVPVVADRQLAILQVASAAGDVVGRGSFARANQNVRAKRRAVNSAFLVQLRKILARDSYGSAQVKIFFKGMAVSRMEG